MESVTLLVEKVLADGGYDSRDNFNYLDSKGIEPVIKTRKMLQLRQEVLLQELKW